MREMKRGIKNVIQINHNLLYKTYIHRNSEIKPYTYRKNFQLTHEQRVNRE